VTIQQALERLRAAEVRELPLTSLQVDEALQPRNGRMVPFREQTRVEGRSREHIGTMRLALEASQAIQLEPVLVAEIDDSLYVIDGHHRLKAYQLAGRETVPARVYPMGRREAVLVSKLSNCGERALEMHAEQKRDAAWQYLAAVTRQGKCGLPEGESRRTVVARFGIGYGTVDRMLHKLPKVNTKDFPAEALDPGTGWPRWRYTREAGAGWLDMENQMTSEQRTQHEAEKLARKIGGLLDKATPAVGRRALEMVVNEDKLAASNADTLAFLADIAEPDTGDY